MNKQSNIYTLIYIVVLVVVVGTALAFTSISLKDKQQANADADKMRQILASVNITDNSDDIATTFHHYITDSFIIDSNGIRNDSHATAFNVDVAAQSKEPADCRMLPVYVCTLDDGTSKYILPLYGAGLWGPIWGYLSVDSDGSTIYGAYFNHESETPGLGAEITREFFRQRFIGKKLIKDDKFMPIVVVKAGQVPQSDADYIDGISGGTITSKGVGAMIDNCVAPYQTFLESLSDPDSHKDLSSYVD